MFNSLPIGMCGSWKIAKAWMQPLEISVGPLQWVVHLKRRDVQIYFKDQKKTQRQQQRQWWISVAGLVNLQSYVFIHKSVLFVY